MVLGSGSHGGVEVGTFGICANKNRNWALNSWGSSFKLGTNPSDGVWANIKPGNHKFRFKPRANTSCIICFANGNIVFM